MALGDIVALCATILAKYLPRLRIAVFSCTECN
jgi:hypothetical protein